MLGTAEQLAAGLGARPKAASKASSSNTDTSKVDEPKTKAKSATDGVGNAHLRLWIGERALGALLAYFCLRFCTVAFMI
jgi:hypothetical protein